MELIPMLAVIAVLVSLIVVSLKDKRNDKKEFNDLFKRYEDENIDWQNDI